MIPLQDNANMDDPVEHVLWALVNPGGRVGAPVGMPMPVMRALAKQIYDAGFRHNEALQTIYYVPPNEGATILNMGGRWVEATEPGVRPAELERDAVGEAIAGMTEEQRMELIERLQNG